MTIDHFVKTAINGGWKGHVTGIFLDPLAWQAVGKVEGWVGDYQMEDGMWMLTGGNKNVDYHIPVWQGRMRVMIDALCEGKTLEEFIETL